MRVERYDVLGGLNYADNDSYAETFETLDGARREWTRRRNNWAGRFPCWGDGGPDSDAVCCTVWENFGDDETADWVPVETVDVWTARELVGDDIGHYYDIDDEND